MPRHPARQNVHRWPSWLSLAAPVAVLCGALPLLAGRPAALEDWPGHVARLEILTKLLMGNEFWSRFYEINTALPPNLGVDVSILALHAIGLTVPVAAQSVLVASYFLFVAAAWLLARAAGTGDPFRPLFAVILFYNGALMDGFVDYMLGAGVALGVLAAWLAVRRPAWRVLVAVTGAVAVFYCHLIAAGFLLCAMGLLDLAALWRERPRTLAALGRHASPLAAAIAVLGLFALSPTSGALRISYGGGATVAAKLLHKLALFVHPVVDGSGPEGAAILLAGSVVLVGSMIRAAWRGSLTVATVPGWWLLVPGLTAMFLILPNAVGQGLGLDYRLPPLVFLVALLFARLEWHDRRARSVCFAILLTVSLARSASFARDATANAAVYREFAATARTIPADSMLLSGIGTPRAAIPWAAFWRPPAEYMATLAVADQVFVPSVFAVPSQHTLVLDEIFRDLQRQFDLSDPDVMARMMRAPLTICRAWTAMGHAGSVFMLVVYPSAASDAAFPPEARRATGTGFRLVDLCAAG